MIRTRPGSMDTMKEYRREVQPVMVEQLHISESAAPNNTAPTSFFSTRATGGSAHAALKYVMAFLAGKEENDVSIKLYGSEQEIADEIVEENDVLKGCIHELGTKSAFGKKHVQDTRLIARLDDLCEIEEASASVIVVRTKDNGSTAVYLLVIRPGQEHDVFIKLHESLGGRVSSDYPNKFTVSGTDGLTRISYAVDDIADWINEQLAQYSSYEIRRFLITQKVPEVQEAQMADEEPPQKKKSKKTVRHKKTADEE